MRRIKNQDQLKSFYNRSFGVEIEFVSQHGKNYTATRVQDLANLSLPADNQVIIESQGYNHNVSNTVWKLVTDSSVRKTVANSSNYQTRGLEIVSPILKGKKGVAQLEAIVKAMTTVLSTGEPMCAINRTCGLHVHHDVREWRGNLRSEVVENNNDAINKLTNLITLTTKYEGIIYGMLPSSRRTGQWCRPVNECYDSVFGAINGKSYEKRAKKVSKLKSLNKRHRGQNVWQNSRYCGLNTASFFKYGTVEFRYGSPTLNFNKMINWIVFTQAFVNMAEVFKTVNSYSEIKLDTKRNIDLSFDKMRDSLGLSKRQCQDDLQRQAGLWCRKRFNHFNPSQA